MEEETEQLDYDDEDELEVARKKAKELRKELELMARKQASAQHSTIASELPTAQSTSSVVTTSTTINSSSNAPFLQLQQQQQSMPRPGRYYVNPNFNVNRHKSFSHHPHMNSLPTSMTRPPRFTQPMTYYPNQQQIYTHHHQPRHILQAFPPQMQAQQHFSHPHQQFIYRPGAPPVPPVPANPSSNNIYINRSAMSSRNNWDLMVDEFVRKNISSARRRRHSRSRSSSKSSTSGYSRPRSRSKSRSSSSSRRRNSSRKKSTHPPTANVRKNGSNQQVKIMHQTMECARAIGLDEEYLKKVEEQSRLREEIARRKSQHRKKENSKAEGKSEAALHQAAGDGQASARKRPKIQGPLAQAAAAAEDGKRRRGESPGKLRPYLAVVVTNLRGVTKAQQKIVQLGAAVGPVKKIWRVGPDDCHVIFEKHEHAKQFMLEHHGKQVDKACIDVTLKKVFLNLTGAGGITTE